MKIYIPTAFSLLVLVVVDFASDVEVSHLTRDAIQIVEAPIYYGLYSNIGILLWCAAAAICLLSAAILKRVDTQKRIASFLLCSGWITIFLLCDDLFLLHDAFFPDYLLIPDRMIYAAYGIAVLTFLAAFRSLIMETQFLLLAFALIFFAVSIIVDIPDIPFYGQLFIEDGCKLFGIVSWAAYFIHLSWQQLLRACIT